MKRRVVVTGMGAISPIGNTVNDMWESAKAGKCGIDFIKGFDASEMQVKTAGEVKDYDPLQYMDRMKARRTAKFAQFALIAADEAVKNSGLNIEEENPYRCGVNISSGIGGLPTIEAEHFKGMKHGFDRVSPLFVPMSIVNMASGLVAIEQGFKGSCTCIVTACASGTNAIGEAYRQIKDGYADVFLTGGAESCISELGIGGFTSMKALSASEDPMRASIPFDKERTGFVMGEGAGVLMLEEYEHAKARGAEIICEIAGYAADCDANHMTAPLEDGSGAAMCMKMAMEDAGIEPSEVGYINAHGTSTKMNDMCETRAVKTAFGEHAYSLKMSSTKSMTGHLLGASGGVEAVLTALCIKNQFALPTVNYREKDEECDLDIVPNEGKSFTAEYAMSNSLGFGGHNATLVFKEVK